ncbi:hypothetical protein GGR63_000642 [Xanthomonas sp. 3272]|uniref:hypothetical protein n=1 Tax=Xanthomonas arboricola TaxID=56448 RepID=UPI001431906E|nr:hypothetical protein [Xanthomonas arboricola]NJC00755.1 hypothetical protein [Xanthomonas arboricola]
MGKALFCRLSGLGWIDGALDSPFPIPGSSMRVRDLALMAPLASLDRMHSIGSRGVAVYEVFTEPADISRGIYNYKTGVWLQVAVLQHIGRY